MNPAWSRDLACFFGVRSEDWRVAELISIDKARARVLEAARALPPLEAEEVALDRCLGRVLADDAVSGLAVPPFDASAMDGYALVAGSAGELDVTGEARAGHPFEGRVEPGTAVRISTGAPVPAGADSVVPVERTEPVGDGRVRVPDLEPGANVRRSGEDVQPGQVVLAAGTEIGPAEAAVLASLGCAAVRCAGRPSVALLVTGDELVEPGTPLGPGQINSSNPIALAGQVERAGAVVALREQVADTAEATRDALRRALDAADVVCVSGGVSVGEHDHVKGALAELGIEERFWGVALKPGKPTWFGLRERVLVFGLPGNPVSAMVTFQLFARPALRAMLGADPEPARGSARLDAPVRLSPKREQAVRVRLRATGEGWRAEPTGPQQSHILTSMLGAHALALIPRGEGDLGRDERVEIELLA
jgi:molybdopterin molybdotransferase